jgi:hypothetical protein
MLSMQKHSLLLEKSIVNYRDVFYSGTVIDDQTQQMRNFYFVQNDGCKQNNDQNQ